MAVLYQHVPLTLDPYTPIPDGAPLSSGLTEEGAAEVIAASETFTSETAVGFDVTVGGAGLSVEATLTPTAGFVDGFQIDWAWGDGRYQTGTELTAAHDYLDPGIYDIEATVTQPGQPSFALSLPAVLVPEATPV